MTIYINGQQFKYELEGICKLFFPVVRFEHRFEEPVASDEHDYVLTCRDLQGENTHRSVTG